MPEHTEQYLIDYFRILDRPVPPERKYKPKPSLIVLAFTAASLFVALGTVFTVEYLRRIKSVL